MVDTYLPHSSPTPPQLAVMVLWLCSFPAVMSIQSLLMRVKGLSFSSSTEISRKAMANSSLSVAWGRPKANAPLSLVYYIFCQFASSVTLHPIREANHGDRNTPAVPRCSLAYSYLLEAA